MSDEITTAFSELHTKLVLDGDLDAANSVELLESKVLSRTELLIAENLALRAHADKVEIQRDEYKRAHQVASDDCELRAREYAELRETTARTAVAVPDVEGLRMRVEWLERYHDLAEIALQRLVSLNRNGGGDDPQAVEALWNWRAETPKP